MAKTVTRTLRTLQEMIDDLGTNHRATEKARFWCQQRAVEDGHWAEYTIELWTNALQQIGFTDVKIAYSGFCSQGDGASFTAGIDILTLFEFFGTEREPEQSIGMREDEPDKEEFRPWLLHKTNTRVGDNRYLWLSSSDDMANYHIKQAEIARGSEHRYVHENTCSTEFEFDEGSYGDNHPQAGECRGQWISGTVNPHADGYWQTDVPHVEQAVKDFFAEVEEFRVAVCKAIYRDLEADYTSAQEDEQITDDCEANGWTFDEDGDRKN